MQLTAFDFFREQFDWLRWCLTTQGWPGWVELDGLVKYGRVRAGWQAVTGVSVPVITGPDVDQLHGGLMSQCTVSVNWTELKGTEARYSVLVLCQLSPCGWSVSGLHWHN